MSTNFPTNLDSLSNPNANTTMNAAGFEHSVQHTSENDAIEALETKVGVDNSAVTNSLDYLVKTGGNPGHYHTNTPTSVVMSAATSVGIMINTANPTWGWRDITSSLFTRNSANAAVVAQFRGTIYDYQFTTGAAAKEAFANFHIPHDYVMGSDLHIHIHTHWSLPAAELNKVKWNFDISYAKRVNNLGTYNAFIAPITTLIVATACNATYGHRVSEIQITGPALTGSMLRVSDIEPDGILLTRIYRDNADPADTVTAEPFLHFIDIHYQSTNLSTKNKEMPYYG